METPTKDAVGRMVATHPRYVRFIGLMLETGLRIDELLNAHFRDNGEVHPRPGQGLEEP